MPRLALIQSPPAPDRQLSANRPFSGALPPSMPVALPAVMRTLLRAVCTG